MKTIKLASLIFFLAAITWGCNQSTSTENESKVEKQVDQKVEVDKKAQVKLPEQQKAAAPAGGLDEHGRKPGDEHYGHSHAPKDQQQNVLSPQATKPPAVQSTGPDKFGRNPGDQHYGHDHE